MTTDVTQEPGLDVSGLEALMEMAWDMARCSSPTDRSFLAGKLRSAIEYTIDPRAYEAHRSGAGEPVAVKPLEWRKPDPDNIMDRDDCQIVATGLGGQYAISHRELVRITSPDNMGLLLWDAEDAFSFTEHLTVEAAKAAAQADYEKRILSALASPASNAKPMGCDGCVGGLQADGETPCPCQSEASDVRRELEELRRENAELNELLATGANGRTLVAEARARRMEEALREIAFMRPFGPTRNKMVERMERIALDALNGIADIDAFGACQPSLARSALSDSPAPAPARQVTEALRFHIERAESWLREMWRVNDIDLHFCDGTKRASQFGILHDIRDDTRAILAALQQAPAGEAE